MGTQGRNTPVSHNLQKIKKNLLKYHFIILTKISKLITPLLRISLQTTSPLAAAMHPFLIKYLIIKVSSNLENSFLKFN